MGDYANEPNSIFAGVHHPAPWDDIRDSITNVIIENAVTHIGEDAFIYCTRLTSVTIPGNVASIGHRAFYKCTALGSVTIEEGVDSIGAAAFYSCTALVSVIIPSSLLFIGRATFKGCKNLTSVTIPGSLTSVGEEAFAYCEHLASITVATDNAHHSSEDGVLFDKNKTILQQYPQRKRGTSYTIPSTVTSIDVLAFQYGCADLTSLTIPGSITSIGWLVFQYCKGLESVTIGDGVTSIGMRAFVSSGLKSVTIPNSVDTIAEYAFALCTGITSVEIGVSVTSIKQAAFWGCKSLTSITSLNPIPPDLEHVPPYLGYMPFEGIPPNACLNVPANSLAAYRAAKGWRDFKCVNPLAAAPGG
ncbi:MAG: leucine-rich repeat domain-containing protein [Chitinispirillales bacterium]|nr:leucine-rich repeat domain-containing protein [Chitinispirillales bacterium]